MTITAWISIIGLFLLYSTSLFRFWIKINIKIKELEMKIISNRENLDGHITRAKTERDKIDDKFEKLIDENKHEHQSIMEKQDTLLSKLNDFILNVEKRIK